MIHQRTLFLVLCLFFLILSNGPAISGQSVKVRKPAHAGTVYPSDQKKLLDTLKRLTQHADIQTKTPSEKESVIKAVVMPHGNINQIGKVSACISKVMTGKAYDKVIFMSPDHFLVYNANTVSDYDYWETPLGRLEVHSDSRYLIEKSPKLFP